MTRPATSAWAPAAACGAGVALGLLLAGAIARREARVMRQQLARQLGHDLRAPLHALLSAVEVLAVTQPGTPMDAEARAVASRQVRRLAAVLDEQRGTRG